MAKKKIATIGACVLAVTPFGACLTDRLQADPSDALWRTVQEQPVKGDVIVGWKVARTGRPLGPVAPEEREAALRALRAIGGVEILAADTVQPHVTVNVASPEALAAVRALPGVAFVEPRYARLKAAALGCPDKAYDGFQGFDPGWQINAIVPFGRFARFTDHVPWHFVDLTRPPRPLPFTVLPGFRGHRIVDAWRRKGGGRGARISIVDTGVASTQLELAATCDGCVSQFAGGLSRGRTMSVFNVFDDDAVGDSCGHGTAAASAALAPLDARLDRVARRLRPGRRAVSVVGAAWASDGASVRINDDVLVNFTDVTQARDGIRHAVCGGPDWCIPPPRQVVSMAWGDISEHEAIREEIALWAGAGVLFLGAAGTGFCRLFDEPVYPAAQTYPDHLVNPVLAVTCVNPNTGERSDSVCKSYDLAGVWHREFLGTPDDWPALGLATGEFLNFGSSSGCVSTVAGIAALTWAAHPDESREEIIQRLHAAGRFGNADTGSGVVDAFLAVGGLGDVTIEGPSRALAGTPYELGHRRSSGDGPFRFEWTDASCAGTCDFDRGTGTCRGTCPLVGTCAAGHPACERVVRTAPATPGDRQGTVLRVIDEGSNDASPDLTVRTHSQTLCAQTAELCTPTVQCGDVPDGCGGTITCGTCEPGWTCQTGQCVCPPGRICDL